MSCAGVRQRTWPWYLALVALALAAVLGLGGHARAASVAAYTFSGNPVAPSGALGPGGTANVVLTPVDGSGKATVGATVYLSFDQGAGGGGAAAQGLTLTTTTQAVTTDTYGHIDLTYDAPSPLPASGADTIVAQDAPTGPTVTAQDAYTFSGPGGTGYSWSEQGAPAGCTSACSAAPPPRYDPAMAYNPATGTLVLFGGSSLTDGGAMLNDTWTWDGSQWTQQHPANSPSPRYGARMAYDPLSQNLLLFGGADVSNTFFGDTWAWNGTDWIAIPTTASPSPRYDASMASDPAANALVLFGGWNGSSALGDTWVWHGTSWSQANPATSPSARSGASMTYDAANGSVVLFGGTNGGTPPADTEVWDGTTWTPKTPAHSPPATSDAGMAYDQAEAAVVLFEGVNGTWTWSGADWTQQSPAASPPDVGAPGAAYDAYANSLVLFGGEDASQTLYNATWTWAAGATANAPAVATTSLPAATVGAAYSQQLSATGGSAPYTWSVTSGSTLPSWLTLSSAGQLSGTPTGAGTVTFTAQVTDAAGATAVQALSLAVNAPTVAQYVWSPEPAAATGTLPAGSVADLTLTAEDASGHAVPAAAIYLSFTPTSGGGSAFVVAGAPGSVALTEAPQPFTADTSGQIQVAYDAPTSLPAGGTDTLTAQDAPSSPTVTAQDTYTFVVPAAVTIQSAAASVAAGGTLTFTGEVTDAHGHPVPGATVDLTLAGGLVAQAVTGSAGTYQAAWVAPGTVGSQTVTASVVGAPASVQMAVTVQVVAGAVAHLTLRSTPAQAGAGAPVTLSGLAVDAFGNPVSNAAVSLTVSGGTLRSTQPVTGADGTFTATWTLPSSIGFAQATASANGATASATAGVTPGAPATITLTPSSSTVGAGAEVALSGQVTDAFGNAIRDATVTLTASAGTLSASSVATDADGSFSATFAAPSVPRAATLTASVAGTSPVVSAGIQVTATAAITLAAAQASTAPGGTLTLTGTVTGAGGVPLDGLTVSLTASVGTISPASPVTGSDGTYQATLTAPATPGPVDVTATLSGASGAGAQIVLNVGFPLPSVTSVSPDMGAPGGGDTVTIRGTGLTGASGVYFGNLPAANVTAGGDGSITAQAPAGTGTADVRVTTEPVATTGLLLYYKAANADGAGDAGRGGSPGTIRDLTGNGDDAALQNMPSATGGGFVGDGSVGAPFALSFAGGGEVLASKAHPLPGTFALDAWFKSTAPGGQIVGVSPAGSASPALYLDGSGHLVFHMDVPQRNVRSGCGGTQCGAYGAANRLSQSVASQVAYTDGLWHEAVATFAGSQLALYVDGQQVGAVSVPLAAHPSWGSAASWQLGGAPEAGFPGATAAPFTGQISSVRVYARALTAQELTENDKAGPAPVGGFSSLGVADRYTYRLSLGGANFYPGMVGQYYGGEIDAVSGVRPYTWSVTQGALPPGLALGPAPWSAAGGTGLVSGTPKSTGAYAFTVQVKDSAGQVATQPVQMTVGAGFPSQITMSAGPSLVTPGGTATVTGVVEDSAGDPVPDASVSLSAQGGSLAATTVTTDANGRYTAVYTAPSDTGVQQLRASLTGSSIAATSTVAVFSTSGMVLGAINPARAGPGYAGTFTIYGWGFQAGGDYSVTVGGNAVSAQVLSSTELQISAPQLADGTYDVTVTAPGGARQTMSGALSVTTSLPMGSSAPSSSSQPTTPYLSFAGGLTGGDTLTIDGLTINYGNLNVVDGNTVVLSAPILIDGVLHYDGGQLTVATGAGGQVTVSGSAGGSLYVDTNIGAYPKVYLYQGAFSIQPGGSIALPDLGFGNQLLKIAGFSANLTRLSVTANQVSLVGTLDVVGAKANLSNFTVGSAGITAAGAASLPNLNVAGIGIDNVQITFDTTHGAFNGQGMIALPMLSAGGDVSFYDSKLQSVSVSIGNFNLNLPGTPVFVNNFSAGASGINQPPLQFQSGAGFSAPYGAVGAPIAPPFTGGVNLTFTVGQSLQFNGQLVLFGKFNLASVSGSVTAQQTDLSAQVNAGPIANGNANLHLRYNPWYFHGGASANVTVPKFTIGWWTFCPCTLGGVAASVDSNGGITASVTVFNVPVTVGVGWDGRISVNGWYVDPAAEQVTVALPKTSVPLRGSARVTGTVLDADGHPVPEATVELTSTLGSIVPSAVVTDARGGYQATLVAAATKGTAGVTAHVRGAAPSVATTLLVGIGEAADPVVDSTIVVPSGLQSAILGAQWQTGTATLTLVSPTGQAYTPTNSASLYAAVTGQNEALYNIPAPAPGNWTAELSSAAPVGTVLTGLLTPLAAPAMSVASATYSANTLTVTYSASTFNGQGAVNLYYNATNATTGGTPFAVGLPVGNSRSATWTPDASVPSGTYYIYGTVDDGVHPAASTAALAAAPFTWTNADTPAAPQGVSVMATDGHFAIGWQAAPAGADVNDYRVTAFNGKGAQVGTEDVGNVTSYTWTGLTTGQTYGVEVTAVNSHGVAGAPSAEVSAPLPVPQPPSLTANWSAAGSTAAGTAVVAGTVSGAASLTVSDNGTALSTTPAGGGTFALPLSLLPGSNNLQLTAVSPAGDTSTSSDSVFYDPAPATLALTGPIWDGTTVTTADLPLSGLTDPGDTVSANDQAIRVSPSGAFLGTLALQPGLNTVTVTATTPAGADTVLQGDVTYQAAATSAPPPAPSATGPGQIGPDGGELSTTDGAFAMFVPAGSLSGSSTLAVAEGTAPTGTPAGLLAAGPELVLTGSSLAHPATATIRYSLPAAAAGLSPLRLSVYRLEADGTWRFVPTRVDPAGGTLEVQVSGPATLAVLADDRLFHDLSEADWSAPYVDRLLAASVVNGYPDGTFQPDAALTRAQFVKMLVLATGLAPSTTTGAQAFTDVSAGEWFTPYVAAALQAGLVQGETPTAFAPDATITREQMAVLLARALKLQGSATLSFQDGGSIDEWAQAGIQAAVSAGYLNGFPDGRFQPGGPTTRAQAAKVLALAIQNMAP